MQCGDGGANGARPLTSLVMFCCHVAVSAALCEECARWACPIHKQHVCRPSQRAVVSSRHWVAAHLKRADTYGSKGSCDSGGSAMTASVPATAVALGHHRAPALEHGCCYQQVIWFAGQVAPPVRVRESPTPRWGQSILHDWSGCGWAMIVGEGVIM